MKQKFLTMLTLLLALVIGVPATLAETLTVADGTDTNAYVPVEGYYLDNTGTRCSFVYPESDLTALVGKQITHVTFYANAGYPKTNPPELTLGMGTSESTVLSGFLDLPTVGTGGPTTGVSEMTIELSSPLIYNGGNLAFDFKVSTKGGYASATAYSWFGVSQTETTAWTTHSATSGYAASFLPKVMFTYDTPTAYAASVSTEAIAFGELLTGKTIQQTFTLKNTGLNEFSYSISGAAAPFSIEPASGTLASSASQVVTVTFAPSEAGEHTASLSINCGDAGSYTVALSGTGIVPTSPWTIIDGTTTNSYVPLYGSYLDTEGTTSLMFYPSDETAFLTGQAITGIRFFANASISNSAQVEVRLGENISYTDVDAVWEQMTTVKTGQVCSTETGNTLTITFDNPFTYSGGQLVIATRVTSTGSGRSCYFYGITQSDNTAYYKYKSSFGTGTNTYGVKFLPKTAFFFEEPQAYKASVSVDALDFGTVLVGSSKQLQVTLRNQGSNAFTPSISVDAPFSTDVEPAELAAGAALVIPVTYAPTAAGENSATMSINCGDAGTLEVALSGNALAVPTGYQETFDGISTSAILPTGWKAVSSTTNFGNDVSNYREESSPAAYTVLSGDDGEVAIQSAQYVTSSRYYYLITPKVNGEVMLIGKYVNTASTHRVQAFAIEDGTIKGSTPLEITWAPELSATGWSYGTLQLEQAQQLAIAIPLGALNFFAADELVREADIAVTAVSADEENFDANRDGTVTISLTATVQNKGLLDVAAGDYTFDVYLSTDTETPIATGIAGTAVAIGETVSAPIEFTYAHGGTATTNTYSYVVKESLKQTSATVSNVKVTALVPVPVLYKADGTTKLTDAIDLGVFTGSSAVDIVLANEGNWPLENLEYVTPESVTAGGKPTTLAQGETVTITLTVDMPVVLDNDPILTISADGIEPLVVNASGACLADETFLEDFEDTLDDGFIVGSSIELKSRTDFVSGADISSNHYMGYASAYVTGDAGTLITPRIHFDNNTGLNLTFTTAGYSFGPSVAVSYSTDRNEWTAFEGVSTERSAFTTNVVSVPAEGDYYFKFVISGAGVDDIYGGERVIVEHDAMFTSFTGETTGMVNYSKEYTATLKNVLSEPDEFIVTLYDNEDMYDNRTITLEGGESREFTFDYIPRMAGTHDLQVKAVPTKDDSYEYTTAVITVEVAEEGAATTDVFINEGNDTNTNVPYATLTYYQSGSHLIYTAAEMDGMVNVGDKIAKIGFPYRNNSASLSDEYYLWTAQSENTTPATDAMSVEGFTLQVEAGQPDAALNTADGIMWFTLSEPITYEGKSLEVIFATKTSSYNNKTITFYGKNTSGNQAAYYKVDNRSATVPEFVGSLSSLTATNFLPTMGVLIVKDAAVVTGVVTNGAGEPVEGATVTAVKDDAEYRAVTDATGAYTLNVLQSGDWYTITVAGNGYELTVQEDVDLSASIDGLNFVLVKGYTIAQVLEQNITDEVKLVDYLAVAKISAGGNVFYTTDGQGNWMPIQLPEDLFDQLKNVQTITGVRARFNGSTTAPMAVASTAEAIGENVQYTIADVKLGDENVGGASQPAVWETPSAGQVVNVTGYYFVENGVPTLRGYSNGKGRSMKLATAYAGGELALTVGAEYKVTVAVELAEAWSGAPRRIATDDAQAFSNLIGQVVSAEDASNSTTAVSDLNVDGKLIDKVTYVNAAGQVSDSPFEGVNIVVTTYDDGTTTAVKVIR